MRLLFPSALLLAGAAMVAQNGVEQPIPYSHKTHVALGLKCAECHTMPGKGELAMFPPESKCMSCHVAVKKDSPSIQKLAAFAAKKEPVPWVRVYKLPGYVWFSHKVHAQAAGCAQCHGPVAERDALWKEKPVDMNSCMACHDQHKAPNECNVCHNPA